MKSSSPQETAPASRSLPSHRVQPWMPRSVWAAAIGCALAGSSLLASTAFTYQGRLIDGCCPADGLYDLRFGIYDTAQVGSGTPLPAGNPQVVTHAAVSVVDGLFTVSLDFGANVFTGPARYLEMAVRTNRPAAPLNFTTLGPRTELTPTPYAIHAQSVDPLPAGSIGATQLANNSITAAKIPTGQVVKSLNNLRDAVNLVVGPNLTLTTSGNDLRLGATNVWSQTGNAGTNPGNQFLGTTDNQALEIKVNNERALRIEPRPGAAASLAAGYAQNEVNGATGAVIAGGGTSGSINRAKGNYATVSGGHGNEAVGFGVVGGGAYNQANAAFSVTAGGTRNLATGEGSVIGGGQDNRVRAAYATVPGGNQNEAAGIGSFAAGSRAKALHSGSFVFADLQPADFASSGANEFAVRAGGGVRFEGAGLISTGTDNGVKGVSRNPNASGVYGENPNHGYGVAGRSFDDGIGIYGENTSPIGWGGYFVGRVFVDNSLTVGSASLSSDQGGALELGNSAIVGVTPYLDFHWGLGNDQDYNVRLINDTMDQLSVYGAGLNVPMLRINPSGLFVNGTVVNTSDRNQKENFQSVDPAEVLEKVASLPITQWNYKEDPASRHVGPMAQDFFAAFGTGPDERHISTVDAEGIALAAIQGLNSKVEALKAAWDRRDAEIVELRQSVAELRRALQSRLPQANGGRP